MRVSLTVSVKDVSELLDCGELGVAHMRKRGGWLFVIEDLNDFLRCSYRDVCRG